MISPFYFSFIKKHKNFSKIYNIRLFYKDDIFTRILSKLRKHKPYSIPFLLPVKKKDAYNYYDIIKHPMDLQAMQRKIEQGLTKYDEREFLSDLNLIYNNCMQYNIEGLICEYAKNLKSYGEKLVEEELSVEDGEEMRIRVGDNTNEWTDCMVKNLVYDDGCDAKLVMAIWIGRIVKKYFSKIDRVALNVLVEVLERRVKTVVAERGRMRRKGVGLVKYLKDK